MSRLIPIYKDWETDDVRPVACGSAVRRLMGMALAEKIRRRVEGLTEDHQLGLKKTGYEIGIHSARHLVRDSRITGWVILRLMESSLKIPPPQRPIENRRFLNPVFSIKMPSFRFYTTISSLKKMKKSKLQ